MNKGNPRRTNAGSNAYARSGPPRQSHGGTMIGLFIGLVIGVLIAFGVVWYLNKMPLPFQDKSSRPDKTETKPAAPAAQQTPQALPGKPGDKVDEKPRFEFYKILPSGQEPAPAGGDAKQPPPQAGPQPAAAPTPQTTEAFYLQAGAFQKSTDADNLKAKLALMGLETNLQEVNVPDKGVMHRVRVGPFAKLEDMNRVRNQLSQNGIQATVIKIKDAPQ